MPLFISGSNGISGAAGTAALPAVQGTDGNTGVFFPAADQVAIATNGVQRLLVDASGNVVVAGSSLYPLVQGTAVASTSGTAIDFTGIPSWVRRITLVLNGVSTNGSAVFQVQAGLGSVETTGYSSTGSYITTGSVSTGGSFTTTGYVVGNSNSAASTQSGLLVMANVSANIWAFSGSLGAAGFTNLGNGIKSFSGVLDRVRLTTVGGTDTFDAGSVNILFE